MDARLKAFKAYDIRGTVPTTLDAPLAFAIGRAVAELLPAKRVVIGRDARLSGPLLRDALAAGLVFADGQVTDIGMCGTEEIYYAAANESFDAGVMITGSHNPADENGFKIVRRGAIPVSEDSGLKEMRQRVATLLAETPSATLPPTAARVESASYRAAYVRWLLDTSGILREGGRPLKIVADAGNGCAGLVLRELAASLPLDIVPLHVEPDGTFPNGVPNPLLPDRRAATAAAVRAAHADFGVAWDGDFDRCFLYDGDGTFVEGYYGIGLLAVALLHDAPGAKIVHDTRVYWNTQDVVRAVGGYPVMGKAGHAFMKERMRAEDALYGGEMSAHHYFRDFAYCDSGMLPWLLVARLVRQEDRPLAELVAERVAAYPCSGEMNCRAPNASDLLRQVRDHFAPEAIHEDHVDGLNLEFPQWRFNLRCSHTEPLLRLNVESRGDVPLMEEKTASLRAFLEQRGAEF